MKQYFDKTLFMNPLFDYFRWIKGKIYYQSKYWGKHLRIKYKCFVHNSRFGKYNWLGDYSLITNCQMGDFSYCSDHCVIHHAIIGKFCSIGPNVRIAPGKHPVSKFVSIHPITYSKPEYLPTNFTDINAFSGHEKVFIGSDVWIGANCLIMDGVKIGDGAVIGANSVITKDVEPYLIVGGVPGKPIRKRFDDNTISKLLEFKWWNKDDAWIKQNISKFWDINEFLDLMNP